VQAVVACTPLICGHALGVAFLGKLGVSCSFCRICLTFSSVPCVVQSAL
jgi:hypothetical protein